jgi:hypothetical protein
MSALSVAIGALCIIATLITLIPCISFLYWVPLPFAVVGAILGILSVFTRPEGGTRASIIGVILCMATCIIGMIRLVMAGGFL